ncbi:hypothetical protein [Humidesulfovibrio idahonensis]
MKRFPKILAATCAAIALTASLAIAAEATSDKTAPATTPIQANCPGATTGQMGQGRMGQGMMGAGMMSQSQMAQNMSTNQMMNGGTMGRHMRGAGDTTMMNRSL